MFTGIVEEVGKIISRQTAGDGFRFKVQAEAITADMKLGDSINVNGVCQSVVAFNAQAFEFDTVAETVKKTTLGMLSNGSKVNLERALQPYSRMGGHFVLGHTDTTGIVRGIHRLDNSVELSIEYPSDFAPYLVHVGSIAIDGVSLTVAKLSSLEFTAAIIPHTWENTILSGLKGGDKVNLEFDILGKYVQRLLHTSQKESKITEAWLKEKGF